MFSSTLFFQAMGDELVSLRGFGDTARVRMREDHRCDVEFQGFLDDFARVRIKRQGKTALFASRNLGLPIFWGWLGQASVAIAAAIDSQAVGFFENGKKPLETRENCAERRARAC
jgi:hypothetical protein